MSNIDNLYLQRILFNQQTIMMYLLSKHGTLELQRKEVDSLIARVTETNEFIKKLL